MMKGLMMERVCQPPGHCIGPVPGPNHNDSQRVGVMFFINLQVLCQPKFFSNPQPGTPGTWVGMDFGFFRTDRPPGDHPQRCFVPTGTYRLPGGTEAVLALFPEEIFYNPVLQGVEGDHSQSATWG